jgi:hypothetical protein
MMAVTVTFKPLAGMKERCSFFCRTLGGCTNERDQEKLRDVVDTRYWM